MNTARPSPETARFANIDCSMTEVLGPRHERSMLQELAECKRKLAQALAGIKGLEISPDAGPQATAQYIAACLFGQGPRPGKAGGRLSPLFRAAGQARPGQPQAGGSCRQAIPRSGHSLSDLMQEGFCGLLEAIDRFDMTHETKLATYATWWIRQSMQRAVASGAYPVRLTPRHCGNWPKTRPRSARAVGRDEPDATRMAERPKNDLIERIHTATRPTISLDATIDSGSSFSLIQTMSDPDGDRTVDVDTEETIEKLMQISPPAGASRFSRFVSACGTGAALAEPGRQDTQVSKERVRQIEDRALKKLRASAEQEIVDNDSPSAL